MIIEEYIYEIKVIDDVECECYNGIPCCPESYRDD